MIKVEMQPMVYSPNVKSHVLYHEVRDDGFEIVIVNTRGSHPCAYINVPKSVLDVSASRNYGHEPDLDYDAWYSEVHGGFTFADTELNYPGCERGYWLGWDYAHCDDFTCYYEGQKPMYYEKAWTTEEVYQEALNVIENLEYDPFENYVITD